MKDLLLMRHAKSSWKEPNIPDSQRPLNKRGKRDAPVMGRLLRQQGFAPQLVLSSTAVRAQQTAEAVAEELGLQRDVTYRDELYAATAMQCVDILRTMPEDVELVLVIGHNPGLEDLLETLTGTMEHLPTAAIAHVRLAVSHWADMRVDSKAQLIGLWRPRQTA